jgi:hypothetical protein
MIQLGPGGIDQVDGEELDDEEIVVRSARSAHEVVVLQPYAGVSFIIILDDVARHSKMLREMSVMYGAPECLWARPFRTEAASFATIMASMAWVMRASLGLCIVVP